MVGLGWTYPIHGTQHCEGLGTCLEDVSNHPRTNTDLTLRSLLHVLCTHKLKVTGIWNKNKAFPLVVTLLHSWYVTFLSVHRCISQLSVCKPQGSPLIQNKTVISRVDDTHGGPIRSSTHHLSPLTIFYNIMLDMCWNMSRHWTLRCQALINLSYADRIWQLKLNPVGWRVFPLLWVQIIYVFSPRVGCRICLTLWHTLNNGWKAVSLGFCNSKT